MAVLILDTDHLSEFDRASAAGERLGKRLVESRDEVATTIVSVEEQLRGWLAQIHKLNDDPIAQVSIYQRLHGRIEFFANWIVLPWTQSGAELFLRLRKQGVRVGAMDLKIACIAMTNDALLLTRNTGDFSKVPQLKFANWLD
jgi:tRNA(fMet)-specific endonuclease VapC